MVLVVIVALVLLVIFGINLITKQKPEPANQTVNTVQETQAVNTVQGAQTAQEAQTVQEAQPETNSDELMLSFGKLLDHSVSKDDPSVAIVKAQIKSQLTRNVMLFQNYRNVENLVQKYGFDKYSEIQYSAVSSTTAGEMKVISFTVPDKAIKGLANGSITADDLDDYVTDQWLLPTLR